MDEQPQQTWPCVSQDTLGLGEMFKDQGFERDVQSVSTGTRLAGVAGEFRDDHFGHADSRAAACHDSRNVTHEMLECRRHAV